MTEGIDYFVRYVDFPNRANDGCTVVNDDGTYDIYLNTLYPREHLQKKLAHELRHLESSHFYTLLKTIDEIEEEADGELPDFMQPCPPGKIREFQSLDALYEWTTKVSEYLGIDPF
ncbi:MAG: hypothetical protein IKZ82_06215 [Clostridia bacterium]|nr:hypothetical protein [Clostridia bacterium]